ncbi:MAG: 50S ribosomal protein L29 [Candidatus Omnitrophica bacterium]|nr:50S ribosomal protein L29 [Candidatus Omnitrophota bacterium]
MELKELRNLNDKELVQREEFLKKELFGLRQQSRMGQVEKPSRFTTLKKEIAQILTIINERKNNDGKKS